MLQVKKKDLNTHKNNLCKLTSPETIHSIFPKIKEKPPVVKLMVEVKEVEKWRKTETIADELNNNTNIQSG